MTPPVNLSLPEWNSSAAGLTAAERWERAGHRPVTIWMTARTDVAYLLERELFDRGCMVHVLADDVESHFLPELAKMSSAAGLITICTISSDQGAERDRARQLVGAEQFVDIDPQTLLSNDSEAMEQITRLLEARGSFGRMSAASAATAFKSYVRLRRSSMYERIRAVSPGILL